MKNLYLLILFFVVSFNLSCIKEVDFDFKQLDKQVVVNCLFCPDSLFEIHLSYTANTLDTCSEIIENAKIELWSGNNKIDDFIYIDNGDYLSTQIALVKMPYTVKIIVPQYDTIYATDTIPSTADYTFLNNNLYCKEIEGSSFSSFDFNIINGLETDYYEMYLPYRRSIDSTIRASLSLFLSQSNVFASETNDKWGDFYYKVIFSDVLFQNESQNFSIDYETQKVYVRRKEFYETIDTTLIVVFQLNKISEAYFNYRESINQASIINSQPDIYNTNQDYYIYSNVVNGLGIFAGFNPIYDTLIYEGENYN